ncbi:MAG: 23S rRNA (adenine(2030)-N(6))-methyltransferase RlmJ [Motiliproteus sp.]
MLSYRHAFHAGNHGDVLKHLVLANTIDYLLRKETPVLYIDTHAGAGRYQLNNAMAKKTEEASKGIGSLAFSRLPESADIYQQALAGYLKQRQYPGSPLLAADLLRRQDRLALYELHPKDQTALQRLFGKDKRVQVESADGFAGLKARLPAKNSRALVLMDPSYEMKSDYQQVANSIQEGYKRMPSAVFLVWYPVVERHRINKLINDLKASKVRDLWQFELGVEADTEEYGMTASGMLVINPPWVLPEQLRTLLPAIQQQLAPDSGHSCVEQLVPE